LALPLVGRVISVSTLFGFSSNVTSQVSIDFLPCSLN
jgi:hypothetical protein